MKRSLGFVALAMLAGIFAGNAIAGEKDKGAAIVLSAALPGVGEWYNSDYKGGFPLVECLAGYICPCIRLASMIDAADGKRNDALRVNFWVSPDGAAE